MQMNDNATPAVEQRIDALEKSGNRAFDLIKWGFDLLKWALGTVTAVALLIIGYNIWSAKTSYEKDREFLKQQTEILERRLLQAERELSSSNQKQVDLLSVA